MPDDPIPFAKPKTDAELAAQHRAALVPLLEAVCRELDATRADGLVANFAITPDAYGRNQPGQISIVKPL